MPKSPEKRRRVWVIPKTLIDVLKYKPQKKNRLWYPLRNYCVNE